MNPDRRILIIDDDSDFLAAMCMQFRGRYGVMTAKSISEALILLEKSDVDLILLDVGLEGEDGLDGIKKIHAVHPLMSIAMLSGMRDVKTVVQAIRSGAVDYLTKPLENEDLAEVMEKAVATRSVYERCEALLLTQTNGKNGNDSIVYKSRAMQQLFEQVEQIKMCGANILIVGETGTGKDLLARYIHQQEGSNRRPFIAMNCAAIPEHLLESEMFGHETGAFTGASKRRIGRFELAHGGDIFLDEISTMKTMLQVKLLRVLQDKEFCRLGSCSPIYSDCRVISASNQPLDHLIETGSFRLDLYHRLCVIQLVVPPLRERSDDIPLLVEHFIDKFTEPSRRKRFSENAMSRLMEYSWPGNVRELANVVQSLSIMVRGDTICDTSFPAWMMSIRSKNGASAPYVNSSCGLPPDIDGQVFLLKEYVANAERRHIEHALQFHNFEKSKTAAALGISRTTLYLKMREMGVVG